MSKPIYKRWWVWVLVVIFVIIVAAASGGNKQSTTQTTTSEQKATTEEKKATNKPTINMAEFEQIKNGITYEEVTEIIGGPGKVMSESGTPGDPLHTVMYQYDGEGTLGANANMMFQGGKLVNKAQAGLK